MQYICAHELVCLSGIVSFLFSTLGAWTSIPMSPWNTVDSRNFDFAYLDYPLISKWNCPLF